jgi:hypothetical protein
MGGVIRGVFLLMMILSSLISHGQSTTSTEKDINSAGPFPVYITVQGIKSARFEDFRDLSQLYSGKEYKNVWGGEGAIGFAINEKAPFKNLYLEPFCFRYLKRNIQNGSEELAYLNQSTSFRIGWRVNLYFPVTFHPQIGVIYFRQLITRIDNENPLIPGIREANVKNVKLFSGNWELPGIDFKMRLKFLDPIGSSGGAGVYLEYYLAKYRDRFDIPAGKLVSGIGPDEIIKSDKVIQSFSIGVIAPLAVRIKRFPIRPRHWYKYLKLEAKNLD